MSATFNVTLRAKVEVEYVVQVEAETYVDAHLVAEENDADGAYIDQFESALKALMDGSEEYDIEVEAVEATIADGEVSDAA